MKTTLAALAVSLLLAAGARAEIRGAWTAEPEGSGRIHLNLTRHDNNFGHTMDVSEFSGLSPAVIDATVQTPANFELRREAGTVAMEGTFKNGFGAGQFTFTPNPNYLATMKSLGVPFYDEVNDSKLMTMALIDVSTAYVRSLQAEGYHESADQYVAMRIFKITPEYIREMRAAGYDGLAAKDLVASRIHKATPEFINSMRALGYDHLRWDQVIAFRIHRVTPEFVNDLKGAGYEHIPADELIAMRIHGIDANYVKRMNGGK